MSEMNIEKLIRSFLDAYMKLDVDGTLSFFARAQETVLIDASPDLEFQLDCEAIRHIDRIFVTHWHFDHVWGLASLAEPSSLARANDEKTRRP
jgi:phosphoribosyl 1,2-cyclic phosphodiesterase